MDFDAKSFNRYLHRLDRLSETVADTAREVGCADHLRETYVNIALLDKGLIYYLFRTSVRGLSSPAFLPDDRINRFGMNCLRAIQCGVVNISIQPGLKNPVLAVVTNTGPTQQQSMSPLEILRATFENTDHQGYFATIVVPDEFAVDFRRNPLWVFSTIVVTVEQVSDFLSTTLDYRTLAEPKVWPRSRALRAEFFLTLARLGYPYAKRGEIASLLDEYPHGWDSLPAASRSEPREAFVGDYERMKYLPDRETLDLVFNDGCGDPQCACPACTLKRSFGVKK